MKLLIAMTTTAAMALAACGGPDALDAGGDVQGGFATASSALVSDNGRSLNGRSLNGRSLNGRSLNGVLLKGLSVTGVTLGGLSVTGITVDATVLNGIDAKKAIKVGSDFVGSTWPAMLSDGTTIKVRIDGFQPLPAPNADLFGYSLSYQTDLGWVSYCGVEPDGSPVLAIPMAGLWNYGQNVSGAGGYDPSAKGVTFACRHFAIAKCVEMGYRPWAKYNNMNALLPYTVSCTRMLRADYCGTGVPYTVDGTLLDVYDRLGIQPMSQPDWPIEAEWGPNGARCMAPESISRFPNSGAVPPCYPTLSVTGCGASFIGTTGTFLIDRYMKPVL